MYLWYSGVLRLGFRRTLQYEDLFAQPDALLTGHVQPRFAAQFLRQKEVAAAKGEKVRWERWGAWGCWARTQRVCVAVVACCAAC